MTTRDQAIQAAKHQLDELNKDIDQLEKKSADAGEDMKARYRAEASKLREQAKKGEAKLKELKSAGEGGWEKLVAEVTHITDAMKHSYRYFKSQV